MKALITGIAGFCGSHLAEFLLSKNFEVIGIVRKEASLKNIQNILNQVNLFYGDIRDANFVVACLRSVKPDKIYHLAAITSDRTLKQPFSEIYETNIYGTINVLEATRELSLHPVIHISCSSAEYGLTPENPIKEECKLLPITHYGISKAAQDMIGYQYYENYGLRVIRTRAFNVTGPKESDKFVCSSLAKQIAEIEKGRRNLLISVGSLDSKRDFIDVRDVVRGYWLTTEKGACGEVYNLCSGRAWSIRQILDILLHFSSVSEDIKIEQCPERLQKADILIQFGSYEKFKQRTGWQPEIRIEKTLRDLLDYWRQQHQPDSEDSSVQG
ncbi:MAG: GDP-6-deoxy-D-mannose reductase [candidate division WS2 bacterium]|nr:GDP-6-deoxy-D-mannose reductase [Candidatus Psychracetigena formicireducens]